MLQIRDLHKSYGMQMLFDGVNLQMEAGERLALVGRNGHGKSTLFRILLGEEQPDSGTVTMPKNYRIGHLEQHLKFTEPTVLDEACLGLPADEKDFSYKAEAALFGLGFSKDDMARRPDEFSGGFQIRINLAKLLLSEPNLLLLDEPTNYLDIVSMRWLSGVLKSWPGEMILISHDRGFLDSVATHTAALHRMTLKKVRGGTEKLYAQIYLEEDIYEKTRQNEEKKRAQTQVFIDRFRAKATKAAAVQSRVKMLEKAGVAEKLDEIDALDFAFRAAPFEAKTVLTAEDLSFGYDANAPLFTDFRLHVAKNDRIGVIGKNGRGKSTLLNVLAGELKALNGEVKLHAAAKTGYFGQTNIARLSSALTIEEEILSANPALTRTQVRNVCGLMMFDGDKAEKKISVLSGGEKSRVLLGKILAAPANLLLLDEPTNHLDVESVEALVEALKDFPGAVLIVTHSEMILKEVATKLIVFRGNGPELFPGTYDEFLERLGWDSDDAGGFSQTQTKGGNNNKKESRQRRAEIVAERSRALGPLKKEIDAIEKRITSLEKELQALESEMLEASQTADGQRIATVAQRMRVNEMEIEALFEKFGRLSEDYEAKNKVYEAKLRDLT